MLYLERAGVFLINSTSVQYTRKQNPSILLGIFLQQGLKVSVEGWYHGIKPPIFNW